MGYVGGNPLAIVDINGEDAYCGWWCQLKQFFTGGSQSGGGDDGGGDDEGPPPGSIFSYSYAASYAAGGLTGGAGGGGPQTSFQKPKPAPAQPAKNGSNNVHVCFAQLKSRPVDDRRAARVRAVHTFWWVQGSSGQLIISGGPVPPSGPNQRLKVWLNPKLSQGTDTPNAHLVFTSGVSSDNCGRVDSMINAGEAFPNGSLMYDPVWGPNSNTAAKYFGDIGEFSPIFPFNAYGANAPLLVLQVP